MKKRLCTLSTLFVISNAMATGIPVFDGAAATNFITQWTQMLKDYQMLTQQYNQAVQIYDWDEGGKNGLANSGGLRHDTTSFKESFHGHAPPPVHS